MTDELIDMQDIAEIVGVTSQSMRKIAWRDESFPQHAFQEYGRGRIRFWKRSDIVIWYTSSKRYRKNHPEVCSAPVNTLITHFLSGKFDRQEQQLNYFSKRQLARLNNNRSTTVHVEGVYLCRR